MNHMVLSSCVCLTPPWPMANWFWVFFPGAESTGQAISSHKQRFAAPIFRVRYSAAAAARFDCCGTLLCITQLHFAAMHLAFIQSNLWVLFLAFVWGNQVLPLSDRCHGMPCHTMPCNDERGFLVVVCVCAFPKMDEEHGTKLFFVVGCRLSATVGKIGFWVCYTIALCDTLKPPPKLTERHHEIRSINKYIGVCVCAVCVYQASYIVIASSIKCEP